MTLAEACDLFLKDVQARKLSASSQKNYLSLFRTWKAYANSRGLSELTSFDQAAMRTWREAWDCKPNTQRLRLRLLRAFFSHAVDAGWVQASPVAKLKAPKAPDQPTMPLTRDEVISLVTAAADAGKLKERALILLMRYSGLAIRDAVTLRHDAIDANNNMTLRRAKSGELVMLPLHDLAVEALKQIAQPDHPYYFWTGNSLPSTTTNYWRERLYQVSTKAGILDFKPHRLRDTFAVELLLAGVQMQDVSTLLGHSSVSTTERYYAPWNVSRRDRLIKIIREVHACDPLPELLKGRKPLTKAGAVHAAPANSLASTHVKPNSTKCKLSVA